MFTGLMAFSLTPFIARDVDEKRAGASFFHVSVSVSIYDNPGTTHFTVTDKLHARLSCRRPVRGNHLPE